MKNKVNKQECINKLGVFIFFLMFSLLSAFIYSPVIGTNAIGVMTNRGGVDIDLEVDSVLTLSLDKDELNLNTVMNSFVEGSVTATVQTNSFLGYSLGIEDADLDTKMHHTSPDITDVLTSDFIGRVEAPQMELNTWGYSLGGGDYYRIPERGVPALAKHKSAYSLDLDETQIYFGARTGVLTSGTYTDTVIISAYVNGTYDGRPDKYMLEPGAKALMQDFSFYDCYRKMKVGDEFYLTDSRDGNLYKVKKLSSESCWMMDNLRLNVSELNSGTSNFSGGSFTVQYANSVEEFTSMVNNDFNANAAYVDETGGYYTWYTAKAGSGERTSSICPKGWDLPGYYNDVSDFSGLYYSLNNPATDIKNYFPLSDGYLQPGSGIENDSARYWTSTAGGTSDKAYAWLVGAFSSQNYEENKNFGLRVRCIPVPEK